jgi:16S rRNA (uracil1498-N3)-methyltransferase
MQTRRTVAAPDERRAAGRQERYARIIREATEQCGRVRPPCVEGVRSFSQAVAESDSQMAFILHERATPRFSDQLAREGVREADHRALNSRVVLFVGPEGGFTEDEVALAVAHGVVAATLGSRVLRAETASLAAVTLAMDVLDRGD